MASWGRTLELSHVTGSEVCDWLEANAASSFESRKLQKEHRQKYSLYLTRPAGVSRLMGTGERGAHEPLAALDEQQVSMVELSRVEEVSMVELSRVEEVSMVELSRVEEVSMVELSRVELSRVEEVSMAELSRGEEVSMVELSRVEEVSMVELSRVEEVSMVELSRGS